VPPPLSFLLPSFRVLPFRWFPVPTNGVSPLPWIHAGRCPPVPPRCHGQPASQVTVICTYPSTKKTYQKKIKA
jgi:hypothetical protein